MPLTRLRTIIVVCAIALGALTGSASAVPPKQDFRISDVGDLGISTGGAEGNSDIVYNPRADEYLLVYAADDTDFSGIANDELEIFAQRLDAEGDSITAPIRVTNVGPINTNTADAFRPQVVFNPVTNEFLVVYQADDTDVAGIVDEEVEIYVQRLSGLGAPQGTAVRVSTVGDDGLSDATTQATFPGLAYNSVGNEYLVTWQADDTDVAGIVDGELEVYAQRISSLGVLQGASVRVSDVGDNGASDATTQAASPAVVYNDAFPTEEYMVVWQADDTDAAGVVNNEFEIFGQRLSTAGAELGANDFQISDVGDSGLSDATTQATSPAVAANGFDDYVVVWVADDPDNTAISNDEFEIFGQRIDDSGAPVGANDFRISDVGGTGSAGFDAAEPDVTSSSQLFDSMVTWLADDPDGAGFNDRFEVYGQRIDRNGVEVAGNDFRVSSVGGANSDALEPTVALNTVDLEWLWIWSADDSGFGQVDDEFEVIGQRLPVPKNTEAPTISGNAAVGGTLNCGLGSWEDLNALQISDSAFQWQRSFSPIPGATSSAYMVTEDDIGFTLSCGVSLTNNAGTGGARSAAVVPPENPTQGPAGLTGPQGNTGTGGPEGPTGAQGPAGRDAIVTCKPKKTRRGTKVTCKVVFAASASATRVKLVRGQRVIATGKPTIADGSGRLRFRAAHRLRPGTYLLVVRERLEDGSIRVTRTPVVVVAASALVLSP